MDRQRENAEKREEESIYLQAARLKVIIVDAINFKNSREQAWKLDARQPSSLNSSSTQINNAAHNDQLLERMSQLKIENNVIARENALLREKSELTTRFLSHFLLLFFLIRLTLLLRFSFHYLQALSHTSYLSLSPSKLIEMERRFESLAEQHEEEKMKNEKLSKVM